MALVYTIQCDGYYLRGRPGKYYRTSCPETRYQSGTDLRLITAKATEEGWRLGRNGHDHCPICWGKTVQQLGLTDSATPGHRS